MEQAQKHGKYTGTMSVGELESGIVQHRQCELGNGKVGRDSTCDEGREISIKEQVPGTNNSKVVDSASRNYCSFISMYIYLKGR